MTAPHLPKGHGPLEDDANGGHRDSERLLRALRVAVPVEKPERVAARRQALIEAIGREIEQTPERVRRRERLRAFKRAAAACSVAAAISLVGGGTFLFLQRSEAHNASSFVRTVSNSPGDKGVVPEGRALITVEGASNESEQMMIAGQELSLEGQQRLSGELPGSTQIRLEPIPGAPQAHLKLTHLDTLEQSLFMLSGHLAVDVPESRTDRRHVVIVTPDARVEVKGTKFSVDVLGDGSERHTKVRVARGQVLVTWLFGKRLLHAGDEWVSPSGRESEPTPVAQEVGDDRIETQDRSPREQQVVPTKKVRQAVTSKRMGSIKSEKPNDVVSSGATSTLAEQNRLLERAVLAQQSGQSELALQLVDELISAYPDSPLRSTALSERRRILSELD